MTDALSRLRSSEHAVVCPCLDLRKAAAAEIEQLRGNLSLAEERLANYAQENERLRRERESLRKSAQTIPQEWIDDNTRLRAELDAIKRTREQERDYADVCYENEGLRQRCMALAYLLYPTSEPPRVAIDGDLGLREPQSEPTNG